MNCPHCDRLLYSRSRPTCGYCGAVLPAEILLSDAERDRIKQEKAEIERRRVIDKEKEEKRKKEERKRNDMGGPI